jgi:hypothetical protein
MSRYIQYYWNTLSHLSFFDFFLNNSKSIKKIKINFLQRKNQLQKKLKSIFFSRHIHSFFFFFHPNLMKFRNKIKSINFFQYFYKIKIYLIKYTTIGTNSKASMNRGITPLSHVQPWVPNSNRLLVIGFR